MATPCCPLCRGDLGAGLTPQQARARTPALDRFRFSAHRGYAVAEHTSAIRSNASRVRARMMAAPLRPLGIEQLAQRIDLREELAQPHPAVARVARALLHRS